MSDDFDREAEKERLREKLEDDQESRKATEHMSDLLLKGATMTNLHCDTCGDPVFRYDGQEFCPTCGETVEDDGSAPTESEDDGAAPTESEDPETDDGGTADAEPSPAGHGEPARESERSTGASAARAPTTARPAEQNTGRTPETPRSERPPGGDLGEARDSLVRTLSDLAARAEATEDPRLARDLLAAAREAAETLAALDRRGR
ncbi:MAG: Sjogren's syndrome/scleroderma autoantigen 1 family protein [Halobacteriales archaeon]